MRELSSKKSFFLSAFTIIELSVVILIIAILLFGTISSSTIITPIKNKVSRDRMLIIYNSIGNFLYQNKRLPCPASINTPKTDTDNYGLELRDSSTRECIGSGIYDSANAEFLVYGMIPTKTLNISSDFAEDGFGNKFSFYIDKRFAKDYIENISIHSQFSVPSFGTTSNKDIIYIKNRVPGGEVMVNADAIIIVISHGANGFGSFKTNGFQNIIAGDNQEFSNMATNFSGNNATFDKLFYANSEASEEFDDIILFKTRDDFVEDFNLMSIIPCKGNDIFDDDFLKTSVYFGSSIQAIVACPIPFESIKKIKKCDNFGRWVDVVSNCPSQTLNNCTISGTGIKTKIVPMNTQGFDGECDINYSGSYSWSCSSSGIGSVTSNNCIPYCTFPATTGMAEVITPPNQDGEGDCSAGYNGYYIWSCSNQGVGTVILNNCSSN